MPKLTPDEKTALLPSDALRTFPPALHISFVTLEKHLSNTIARINGRFGTELPQCGKAFGKSLEQLAVLVKQLSRPRDPSAIRKDLHEVSRGAERLSELMIDMEVLLALDRELEREVFNPDAAWNFVLLLRTISAGARKARTAVPRRPRLVGYDYFVLTVTMAAMELGIKLTLAGERDIDPHATPYSVFVFEIERLYQPPFRSPTLAACAKRLERSRWFRVLHDMRLLPDPA